MLVKYFIEVDGTTRVGKIEITTVEQLNIVNELADRTEYLIGNETISRGRIQ